MATKHNECVPSESTNATAVDPEKGFPRTTDANRGSDGDVSAQIGSSGRTSLSSLSSFLHKAAALGHVELRGIAPVPVEDRTVKDAGDVFTLWWCMNANILPITFGMLGPAIFGLGLRDCALVALFFTLLTAILPSYCSTFGPKTGMRQMIQARYSFGRFPVCLPVLLNLATLTGFCVIMAVVGGQCLSAAAEGTRLTPTLGIVIVALLSLVISFCGFSVLHAYERYASVPSVIAIIIAAGCGGAHLVQEGSRQTYAPASSILSFGMIVASYMVPFACLASDFTTYIDPQVSSIRIFVCTYTGLTVPTIPFMVLGAAMAGAVDGVPAWKEGYDRNSVGGVMAAMLSPAGGFGRFLVVILSFSLLGNVAATSYSITLNFQMLVPALFRVPRYLFAILFTAIIIPVSIRAAVDFFPTLENFVALIGYWSSAFLGVVLTEHLWFRRGECGSYDPDIWNDGSKLPPGAAALGASMLSFCLVVPAIAQTWYTGPIAKTTGDIGFELAFFVSALLYVPLRTLEKRLAGR